MDRLIVLELNELNFDLIQKYVDQYPTEFRNLSKLFEQFQCVQNTSEIRYQELEPWIQWVSAHTGKTFEEHSVYRLGDVEKDSFDHEQIYEKLEKMGLSIGVVSPMNAVNRMNNAAYFIPDPWTATKTDGSWLSKRFHEMLKQTVNQNAEGHISLQSIVTLLISIIFVASFKNVTSLFRQLYVVVKNPKLKVLFLDLLIHMVHLKLWKRKHPDVSFLFLNGGAHLQHHYMLNSKFIEKSEPNPEWYMPSNIDPLYFMLQTYDHILGDYLDLTINKKAAIVVSTALRQIPHEKAIFYYRLRNHEDFLNSAGIVFRDVKPRMTRDFEVIFNNDEERDNALVKLRGMKVDGKHQLFGDFELRHNSLFLSLTYPHEVNEHTQITTLNGTEFLLYPSVVFVAIKNGKHDSVGYNYFDPVLQIQKFNDQDHIAILCEEISHQASLIKG